MSTPISASLRRLVIQRAGNRCEYCGLSQAGGRLRLKKIRE